MLGQSLASTPGETPVPVLDQIATLIRLRPGSRVLDVGCGCGEALVYWAMRWGISGRGIEWVPVRAECANRLAQWAGVDVLVLQGDCRALTWPEADVVYCVATCFDSQLIGVIKRRLTQMPLNTVVVLVGMTLPSGFVLLHQRRGRFSWGAPMVRVGRRVSD